MFPSADLLWLMVNFNKLDEHIKRLPLPEIYCIYRQWTREGENME
jgi:hypothetical protein